MGNTGAGGEERCTIVLRRIAKLRDERNRSTVKSAIVAEDTPLSPKEVAPVMSELCDEGKLDRWGNSTPQTYTIELPEDFDPP